MNNGKKLKASNQFLMHNGNWSIRWILGFSREKGIEQNILSIFNKMNKICAMRYTSSDSRLLNGKKNLWNSYRQNEYKSHIVWLWRVRFGLIHRHHVFNKNEKSRLENGGKKGIHSHVAEAEPGSLPYE